MDKKSFMQFLKENKIKVNAEDENELVIEYIVWGYNRREKKKFKYLAFKTRWEGVESDDHIRVYDIEEQRSYHIGLEEIISVEVAN